MPNFSLPSTMARRGIFCRSSGSSSPSGCVAIEGVVRRAEARDGGRARRVRDELDPALGAARDAVRGEERLEPFDDVQPRDPERVARAHDGGRVVRVVGRVEHHGHGVEAACANTSSRARAPLVGDERVELARDGGAVEPVERGDEAPLLYGDERGVGGRPAHHPGQ